MKEYFLFCNKNLYGKVVCFCSLNVFISNSRGKCKRVIGVFALIFSADMGIKRKILRKSVLGIYLFEIKRVRRITSFWGNELATVLIAVVCIALLIWVTLYDRKNIKLN